MSYFIIFILHHYSLHYIFTITVILYYLLCYFCLFLLSLFNFLVYYLLYHYLVFWFLFFFFCYKRTSFSHFASLLLHFPLRFILVIAFSIPAACYFSAFIPVYSSSPPIFIFIVIASSSVSFMPFLCISSTVVFSVTSVHSFLSLS